MIFDIWLRYFRFILLHAFYVGLLVRVCYPKRSSNKYSNICSDLYTWLCLLNWKSRSIVISANWHVPLLVDTMSQKGTCRRVSKHKWVPLILNQNGLKSAHFLFWLSYHKHIKNSKYWKRLSWPIEIKLIKTKLQVCPPKWPGIHSKKSVTETCFYINTPVYI